ncbi:MAG: SpoIID/LytB domain-containing protein [Acidobacteriota bacterium]
MILLLLALLLPPIPVWGIEGFQIEQKKYVRKSSEPAITRPRRIKPPDSRDKQSEAVPQVELKPAGPLLPKPTESPEKGPEIRIALVTNAGFATVSANCPLAYYNNEQGEFVSLTTQQVKVQLANTSVRERPGRTYRVQVASLPTGREVDLLVRQLRKRFNEPVETYYDRETSRYHVSVGEFSSQKDAQEFMVRVMNAGYRQTWVAKDESTAKQIRTLVKAFAPEGETLAAVNDRLILTPKDPEGVLRYNGNSYRGRFELFVNKRGRLSLINVLPMEDYIRGVVPNELSPTGFPMIEALKAQAVAARTYAMRNRGQFEAEGFDLLPTALSQVYGGMSTEHVLSDRAVAETKGMVATYQGQPINALYTSTCGGRTESSEFVFNEPLPYLVSVACEPPQRARRVENVDKKEVKDSKESEDRRLLQSVRKPEPILGEGGRAITREIAILDILRFSLPDNPSTAYFLAAANQKEIVKWMTRAAEVLGRSEPTVPKDVTSLAGFATFLIQALYGEDRPSALLSPADADYLLAADAADIPTRNRAEVAALLQDGIITPTPDGSLHPRTPLTRANVLLAITRALAKFGQPTLDSGTTRPLTGRSIKIRTTKNKEPLELEFAGRYYLFRVVNSEVFPATRVEIIGGEKVNYHLDNQGHIDYLEVQPNANGAASDRFSVYSRWQARLTTAEVKTRLAEARIQVGDIMDLRGAKYGYSNRLAELKVVGTQGTRSLMGLRIRSALGLRESLFIITREYDEKGHVNAFRFIGRGWGHGVGMCQVGAYGLALEGLNYEEILKTYYSGIQVTKLY